MKLIRKYRVKFFSLLNRFVIFKNYTISYYFSRFGNNLQQIAIGILYANKVSGNFYLPDHSYVSRFSVINSPINNYFLFAKKYYRFFYFYKKKDFPKQNMDHKYVERNIEEIFKINISKNISFLKDVTVDQETLVFHIRSGDIFTLPIKSYYQNPINFYIELLDKFPKVLIVTSEEMNNPVISELKKYDNVQFQSTSLENDFNTIYNATNLATSGAGTFPIAAALMSRKLKNLYYTNLFLKEHLNPNMLNNPIVKHHKYKIDENYMKEYEKANSLGSVILDKSFQVKRLDN